MREPESIEEALVYLASESEEQAAVGFRFVMAHIRSRVESWQQAFCKNADDREDLFQEVGIRIWRSRRRIEMRGLNYWYAYVKLIAVRCGIDLARSPEAETAVDPASIERVPDEDLPMVVALLEHLGSRNQLYRLADEFWLGPRPPEYSRKALAAKLFYVDGLPWPEVCDLLSSGFPGRRAIRREDLDEWLIDAVLIRYLACEALYLPGEKLADHLLGISPRGDESFEELIELAGRSTAPKIPWNENDIFVILWRYKYGKLIDHIGHMPDCGLKKEEMQEVFDRCRDDFPFLSMMRDLQSVLDRTPRTKGCLGQARIWKRIVFQYFAAEELPHRDIHDRTSPAAALADYSLTHGMLNVWLSNGRLLKQLAQFAQRGASDE